MELPNPDAAEGRAKNGSQDRHFCLALDTIEPLVEKLEAAGIEYTKSMSGRPAVFFMDPGEALLAQGKGEGLGQHGRGGVGVEKWCCMLDRPALCWVHQNLALVASMCAVGCASSVTKRLEVDPYRGAAAPVVCHLGVLGCICLQARTLFIHELPGGGCDRRDSCDTLMHDQDDLCTALEHEWPSKAIALDYSSPETGRESFLDEVDTCVRERALRCCIE
eukprot:364833-Chlamydomonas_euryale.AAC.15